MLTINKNFIRENKAIKKTQTKRSILRNYQEYAVRQNGQGILWFAKAIIAIPCVFMVPSILVMGTIVSSTYIWFVVLSMLLFFINIIAHIAGVKGTVFVPLYHITVALLIIIPLITYLIQL